MSHFFVWLIVFLIQVSSFFERQLLSIDAKTIVMYNLALSYREEGESNEF
jgi:hypothetical protein